LHNFTNTDGKFPVAPPIQGIDGNFYGTVTQGGSKNSGTVYKITPSKIFSLLYTFINSTDGANPEAPLVQGIDGNFYGTTVRGDPHNGGTVFKVTPLKQFFPLFDFAQSSPLGSNPFAPLIQGSDGNFYGTTAHGSLVQASDGNLYGTASMSTATDGCGTIFRITLPTGTFSTLHAFKDDKSEGCNPRVTLVQHTNGILYGDTHAGGSGGSGVFFSLKENLRRFVTLLPYSGKVGATIEFLGQGFTSISAVSFDGTPASRTMVSGTFLTATVPSGAGTVLSP
jgi:uncharacterized repeat protein (TIGR03803 family)